MDFSNITGMYADTYANAANQRAAGLQDKLKGADYAKATDAELMDACKQFESYFVEQMFKEMMKTVPETDYSFKATGTMVDYYKDNMIQEIASMSTESGGLGLAQMLYEQMKINNG